MHSLGQTYITCLATGSGPGGLGLVNVNNFVESVDRHKHVSVLEANTRYNLWIKYAIEIKRGGDAH